MKRQLTVLLLLVAGTTFGQEAETNTHKGELSHGIRTTGSLFSASGNYLGLGTGWQIRYRISDNLNGEWFADWITTDLGGLGQRIDAHIGESMLIYPGKKVSEGFTPYIMGGFCGDYTKIQTNLHYNEAENEYVKQKKDRWSFATQLGLGTHYNITERFDISLSAQYVLHFGSDIQTGVETNLDGEEYLYIEDVIGDGLEGHTFITISANFVLVDLIKNK